MHLSKVSIVSSVYNKGPYLKRCLESLTNQTFSDIEIIIVDNGSTDDSGEIIEKYERFDKRIKVIKLKNNIGASGGINVGISHVSSEYFTLCDADDYVPLDYIELLYREMISENADIVMCMNDYVYSDGSIRINKRPNTDKLIFHGNDIRNLLPQLLDDHTDEYLGFYLAEVGVEWAKLYRTMFVKEEDINYEIGANIWCDWLFNFRLLKKANKFVYTEQTIYHNFMSENSVTRSTKLNKKRLEEMEYILKRFEEESLDIDDSGDKLLKARNRFNSRIILGLFGYYRKYYKKGFTLKDERDYIVKISHLSRALNLDIHFCSRGFTLINRMRLFFINHKITLFEIILVILFGLRNESENVS